MAFRFKQFLVEDDLSSMRIGTDAMVMGAWVNPVNAGTILDIGTGCGVLALMMAQKSKAVIHAIDIHDESVKQSQRNFSNSPWSSRLTAFHRSFTDHAERTDTKYDLIISNPPFFQDSLRSPDEKRNLARHRDRIIMVDLFESVSRLLSDKGEFYIILPSGGCSQVIDLAGNVNLYVFEKLNIRSKPGKDIHRVILRFTRNGQCGKTFTELIIRNADNSYSEDYKKLTKEYHF